MNGPQVGKKKKPNSKYVGGLLGIHKGSLGVNWVSVSGFSSYIGYGHFQYINITKGKFARSQDLFWLFLKVALSQKRLEDFYFSKMNIPYHYPEQVI